MSLMKSNDELDSTLLIGGALAAWLLYGIAVAFVEGFATNPAADHMGRFIDSIVLMVFTYKFTKSLPSERNRGRTEEKNE